MKGLTDHDQSKGTCYSQQENVSLSTTYHPGFSGHETMLNIIPVAPQLLNTVLHCFSIPSKNEKPMHVYAIQEPKQVK